MHGKTLTRIPGRFEETTRVRSGQRQGVSPTGRNDPADSDLLGEPLCPELPEINENPERSAARMTGRKDTA